MPTTRDNESGASDRYSSWVNTANSNVYVHCPSKLSVSIICFWFCCQVGLIFLFNLIVGTGALTLPSAFAKTGWLLGLFLIAILAFISYITVTFVVETMACANAMKYWTKLEQIKREREHDGVSFENCNRIMISGRAMNVMSNEYSFDK